MNQNNIFFKRSYVYSSHEPSDESTWNPSEFSIGTLVEISFGSL